MPTLPIAKVRMPSDLKKVDNGQLPNDLLRKIEPSGRMHHLAARAWAALRAKAAEEGLNLVHVGDYRPLEQQISLFMSRMKPFPDAKKAEQTTRKWDGKVWYLHQGAPVATPATSNHGWGLAIDAALNAAGQVVPITTKPKKAKRSGLDFLLAEYEQYGWSHELQSEPWHIRLVCGDQLPPAVLEFEARATTPTA